MTQIPLKGVGTPLGMVIKGTNFRAHFTHIHNGYPRGLRQVTSSYENLGFRTFRPGRKPNEHTTP